MSKKVHALMARIEKMPPAEKLRLAAGLLDKGEYELAMLVGELACANIRERKLARVADPQGAQT